MSLAMAKNRVFFPQEALDAWLVSGSVELHGHDLSLKEEGSRFRLSEGVRIIREVTGEPDSYGIVGKCKTMVFLTELGADILDRSMIVDNNAYDIVPGFLGIPLGSSDTQDDAQYLSSDQPTEEEQLCRFLSRNA